MEDKQIAEQILTYSILSNERSLAKLVLDGVPLWLSQRVEWNTIKKKYTGGKTK